MRSDLRYKLWLATAVFTYLLTQYAMGQTVKIDGQTVRIGRKRPLEPAVKLTISAWDGEHGDERVGILTGAVISQLPSKFYRVELEITASRIASVDGRPRFSRDGVATVVLESPEPGKAVKWRALLRRVPGSEALAKFQGSEVYYTVSTSIEPHVPD